MKREGRGRMKKAKVYYYVDSYVETKELDYEDSCNVLVEEGIVYICPDGNTKLAINKEHFISVEKIED